MRSFVKNKRRLILILVIAILSFFLIIMPVSTVAVYEAIFGFRYETASWMRFSVDEYEGLTVKSSDFISDGVTLAGYQYEKETDTVKGLIVIAHGMGGGGHTAYMPFIDYFTSFGYRVFAYDARGNDESGGDSVEGLPQGIVDLDNAICHTKTIAEYEDLPIALFGHSWGGYAVANVLNFHTDIRFAIIIAGFNESEDMLSYQSEPYAGAGVHVAMPYLQLYERIKFGQRYTNISAISGMENSKAGIMIVHSKNDTIVPTQYGYDKFYKEFHNSSRFTFVLYEDRGHEYLFYSQSSLEYREDLNSAYQDYVENEGIEHSEKAKSAFMNDHMDKKKYFEPDPDLMKQMLDKLDYYCQK